MDRRLPMRTNSVFILLALLLANLSASVALTWWVPGVAPIQAGIGMLLAIWAAVLLRNTGLISRFLKVLQSNRILWPFVTFSLLSVAWSVDPLVSISWWLVLMTTIVVGGFIGLSCNWRQMASYIGQALVIILGLSLLVVVFVPRFGVMYYYSIQGAWKGIFWHKNHMGIIAGLASIVLLVNVLARIKPRSTSLWLWTALYLLSLAFLIQTDSVASYLSVIAVHGLAVLVWAHLQLRPRLRRIHYLLLAGLAIVTLVVVLGNLDAIFGVFNRNTSLTGRIPMWGHLFRVYFSRNIIGGYGLNAFWHISEHRNTMQHLAGYPDPIVIADNGFIDILINTGVVGLLCFAVFYVGLWVRVAHHARRAMNMFELLGLVIMSYGLIANFTWSLLFESESFLMLIMISIMFAVGGDDHRSQPAAALQSSAGAH